ncbi:TlpA family protein disulfide reductase [Algoriphagus winogradskyi]|uniref:Peroxiredoxin n=1 Tax=Algoriphagus winogradskyi TaxID=237017 RepID=A0ABY1NL01_9BACT|nr:TlpA disulfide reductase family protein [Algoriphagus winogradskyi]SMP12195.1 Peroxiredoxin [Algoriphagus winogradskyi]
MKKLFILSISLLTTFTTFGQETIVIANLSGVPNKKDMIRVSMDFISYQLDENLSAKVSSSSEIPTQVTVMKIQSNGKITERESFWVYDDSYQITGDVEDFSSLKISPNHPYNEIESAFYNSDKERQKEIISENLDKAVGVQLMASSVSYYSDEELEQLLAKIPGSFHATDYYTKTKTNLLTKDAPKPKVGMKAIDFELESRAGAMVSLSDFDGKYRLLDFSNSGCGPCFMALPDIKEAYEKYSSEIEVISIWDDKTKDIWMNSSKKHKEQIIWTDLWDAGGLVSSLYQIQILPSYILVNPDGEIEKIWNSYKIGKIVREMDSLFEKN